MAAPNLKSPTTINGVTYVATPSVNTEVVAVSNAVTSGHVYKIEEIIAANGTTTAATASCAIYSNEGTPASAPSGGTSYPIAKSINVPANSSMILVDKETSFYLEEDKSVTITSGTSSALTFSMSYEDIS